MTRHVLYPALAEVNLASPSPAITRPLLRDALGYQEVVISNAMSMKAHSSRLFSNEKRALDAGVNFTLIDSTFELEVFGVLRDLAQEYGDDTARCNQNLQAVERIVRLKTRLGLLSEASPAKPGGAH